MKTLIINGIGACLLSGCAVGGFSSNDSSVLAMGQTEKSSIFMGQVSYKKAASPTIWEPRQ